MAGELGFNWLIDPLDPQHFIDSYLERRPLILKRDFPAFYDPIINFDQINALIHDCRVYNHLSVTLSHAAKKIDPHSYNFVARHERSTLRLGPDIDKVLELYQSEKATIIVHDIARFFPGLSALTQSIMDSLQNRTGSNLFLTPAHSQCFQAHYDENDLFLLQIAGSKHWKIMESAVTLPLEPINNRQVDFSGLSTIAEVDLNAGDLLYLPRGFVHEVTTGNVFSAHITLGLETVPWQKTLAEHIMELALSDSDFRLSFFRSSANAATERAALFARIKDKLLSAISVENLTGDERRSTNGMRRGDRQTTLKEATFGLAKSLTI